MHPLIRLLLLLSILILPPVSAFGEENTDALWEEPLEKALELKVTTAGRKNQTVSKTAGAIFIITEDDIHRSGATNIPDLLRM